MAPTPQEPTLREDAPVLDGERIVISGMSGLYPESANVKDLETILYKKHNPVTDENCRWTFNHPEVRHYTGKVPGLDLFDGQFFKVHYRLGNSMDAMSRKILEQAYQAIYDAGVSPGHLSGKKVGVYVGSCFSETEKASFYVASSRTGFGIAGCNKSMFANRISYWLNAKGPSMSIDESCCSSIAALEQAYQALERGECEAAIVGGSNLCLHPQSSVHYGRIMTLCADGKTKSFDQNADGCAKSEAINVLFLQKAKNAKRIYAEVIHVKSEFTNILEGETGPKYGFYRDPNNVAEFLQKFYKEAKVSPQSVEYVEAFGSAVPEADKAELDALERVFCAGGRAAPLLVGSVMSNIGYGEAASGISAITKVLLGYQYGQIAGNLHCESPRSDVPALKDGRMQILTDHRGFQRSYTAVNGISVTGVNAHVLLYGHYKPKDPNRYKCSYPRLVTISGRQDTAVKKIIDDLKTRPIDPEELALFHNIHQTRISGHLGRGYTILDTDEEGKTISLAETANYFDDVQRPLWFVYSGMGSQWAGMGTQLMRIPVFAAAIERCRKALEPKGVDIVHIITSPDKTIFDNILNSFVGIAAIQIGLTDVLTSLGIVPDKIIGHSVGELGCAYADGCFTAEEMILSAYSRGLVSLQTPFIRGSMAAVGIGYQQVSELVPPEIEVACHNGPESSTISGPADVMKEFVTQLTAQGIFAKEVPCSNIAYHSRYIAEAGPGLLKYLSEVIKDPKPRSERWVSTSVPEEKWNEPEAKTSSAYYHTNNLLSSVLFEETSRLIPANAVLLEIAPHGLLQAILKRSLPESCKNIPLTRRGHKDNVFMVLDAIGKLFMEGYLPKVHEIYPKVEFPVSTGTPMLNHLIEWAHHEKWSLPLFVSAHKKMAAACKFVISVHDPECSYLQGHVIRGTNVYPFAGALVAAWDTLAMSQNLQRRQVDVQFRDVRLWAQPALLARSPLRLSVALHRANGQFEVLDEDRKVATGFIHAELMGSGNVFSWPTERQNLEQTGDDVYQMFYERDHFYRDEFRSIHKVNQSLTEAQIVWNDNWVTFIDGILQFSTLREKHHTVAQPFQIRTITINLKEHNNNKIVEVDDKMVAVANVFETHGVVRCGGVLLEDVQFRKLNCLDEDPVSLKALSFVPRFQSNSDVMSALQVYLQIVAENINKDSINVLGVLTKDEDFSVFNELTSVLNNFPGIVVKYEQVRRDKVLLMRDHFLTEVDLVLVQDISSDDSLCQILYRVLRRDTFLINCEGKSEERIRPSALYRVISVQSSSDTRLELIKWRPTQIIAASTVVTVRNTSELSLLTATREDLPERHKLVVLSTYPTVHGLKDLVKKWRKETDRNQIYLVMISDKDNLDQLPELDLAYNVLINSEWGGEYLTSLQERVKVERGMSLRSSRIGDLDALHWVEAAEPTGPGIPITVHYTAVNDLDVKKATGVIPLRFEKEHSYCMDFSGVNDKGERVMGILPSGAASGRVLARPELTWPVPAHWSLEDAATVPSAYAHAFYCFDLKVQFKRGYRVLVHGAAGALGQAAISIALAHGCEVFAAVSDVCKKQFLMALFPELQEDHIGNDRDASFGDMVNTVTKGKGCNVIISTVKGELKNVVMNSLAASGIMLDVTQIPNQENFRFGMFYLTRERNYKPIDFSSILATNKVEDMKRIQVLMSEGIARGYVRPLSRVTFTAQAAPRAFRLLAGSRQRGRVLLRLQNQDIAAEPRLHCCPDLCQVLLCDKQTFGLQLAERLISRGARKVLLHCAKLSMNLKMKVQSWEKHDVKVQVSSEDLSTNKGVVALLSDSNRLGAVEGIYIVATDVTEQTIGHTSTMISNLDLAARKICPSVRHFAVISAGLSVGQQTCFSRVRNHLPATTLNLPALRKSDDNYPANNSAISWRSAINATERALCSTQHILLAHRQTLPRQTLLQQIATVADLGICEETMNDISLQDLGLEFVKVPAIVTFLQDIHNVALAEENIPYLTVEKIRELEKLIYGFEFKEIQGLETFFSFVDPDELLATTEMVLLPTLTNSATMSDNEFDVSQTYLCILPGMEGHHARFKVLCERLKLPALVLQPGLDHPHESPRDTAERYAKLLLKKACLRQNFYLLGYESGVLVALELAAILEDYGMTGTVFCVGGTPDEFQAVLEGELSDMTSDSDLQEAVAKHMFTLMTGDAEGVDKVLEKASTWREKIESCVRMLLGRVAHSAQYARNLMDTAYVRIKKSREYIVQPRELKSKLVLLRARSLSADVSPVASLQRHSQQPVLVHQLHETLAHSLLDLRCSAIVNSYLNAEIIDAHEQKNLCETYILNAETFMQSN